MITKDPVVIASAGDMAANVVSTVVQVERMFVGSIQCVATGAPVGNYLLEGSNDNVSFAQLSSTAVAAAGTIMITINPIVTAYIRLTYSRTSGTGALTAKFLGKG